VAALALWLLPVAILAFTAPGTYADVAWFFSKMAVVTVGGAYADFGDGVPSGESIAWTVTPAQGGEHDLAFRYSLDGVDRQLQLTVNGAAAGVLAFSDSGTFSSWGVLTARAALAGGQANAVVLSSIGTAGPNIDQLAVAPAPGGGDFV